MKESNQRKTFHIEIYIETLGGDSTLGFVCFDEYKLHYNSKIYLYNYMGKK